MNKRQILNILFWILLIIGIILIVWRISGNSPSELSIIITFILTLMFKLWSISDEMKEFKHEIKFSFAKVKEDFNDLKTKLKIRK